MWLIPCNKESHNISRIICFSPFQIYHTHSTLDKYWDLCQISYFFPKSKVYDHRHSDVMHVLVLITIHGNDLLRMNTFTHPKWFMSNESFRERIWQHLLVEGGYLFKTFSLHSQLPKVPFREKIIFARSFMWFALLGCFYSSPTQDIEW